MVQKVLFLVAPWVLLGGAVASAAPAPALAFFLCILLGTLLAWNVKKPKPLPALTSREEKNITGLLLCFGLIAWIFLEIVPVYRQRHGNSLAILDLSLWVLVAPASVLSFYFFVRKLFKPFMGLASLAVFFILLCLHPFSLTEMTGFVFVFSGLYFTLRLFNKAQSVIFIAAALCVSITFYFYGLWVAGFMLLIILPRIWYKPAVLDSLFFKAGLQSLAAVLLVVSFLFSYLAKKQGGFEPLVPWSNLLQTSDPLLASLLWTGFFYCLIKLAKSLRSSRKASAQSPELLGLLWILVSILLTLVKPSGSFVTFPAVAVPFLAIVFCLLMEAWFSSLRKMPLLSGRPAASLLFISLFAVILIAHPLFLKKQVPLTQIEKSTVKAIEQQVAAVPVKITTPLIEKIVAKIREMKQARPTALPTLAPVAMKKPLIKASAARTIETIPAPPAPVKKSLFEKMAAAISGVRKVKPTELPTVVSIQPKKPLIEKNVAKKPEIKPAVPTLAHRSLFERVIGAISGMKKIKTAPLPTATAVARVQPAVPKALAQKPRLQAAVPWKPVSFEVPAELKKVAGLELKFTDDKGAVVALGKEQSVNIDFLRLHPETVAGKAVWQGFFYAPETGNYYFTAQTNRPVKLAVDGESLLSKDKFGLDELESKVFLKKGLSSIRIEVQLKRPAVFQLLWGRHPGRLQALSSPNLYFHETKLPE